VQVTDYGWADSVKLKAANVRRFRHLIKAWGKDNLRHYPWRRTHDPYKVAVAELMLRRTQAEQVVPTYERFIKRYPSADALGRADAEETRAMLRRLGLQWRAENILSFGSHVVRRFNGQVPTEDSALRSLPGVGEYVSAAVRCFALGQAVPVIDTNTVRVIGRVFGISTEGEARRRKAMKEAAKGCVDPEEPRSYNLALIDFASAVCTARAPSHERCPFSRWRRCELYAAAPKG